MRPRTRRALVALALIFSGCQASSAPQPSANASADASPARPDARLVALIAEVEALRDRRFERPPALVAQPVAALTPIPSPAPRDAALLARALGHAHSAPDAAAPRHLLARYEPDAHQVRYALNAPDAEALEDAIVGALVDGINAPHFPAPDASQSWDERLALRAALDGDAMFVMTLRRARLTLPTLDAAQLAQRPELVLQHRTLSAWLDGPDAGLWASTHREGLALVAALHRARGWSGVEYLRGARPKDTLRVAWPARWLRGEERASWVWPEPLMQAKAKGWEALEQGHVGVPLTVAWLSRVMAPAQARAVTSALVDESYWLMGRGAQRHFIWLSHWATPHQAQQLAQALKPPPDAPFSLTQQGLNVVMVASLGEAGEAPDWRQLVAATPRFAQREPHPITVAPSLSERLIEGAQRATLDAGRWHDPALGVSMRLDALDEGWDIQRNTASGVRWYARRQGALLQLTIEPRELSATPFDDPAWGARMEAALTQRGANPMRVTARDEQLGASGRVRRWRLSDATDTPTLEVWQTALGPDVLLTFSLGSSDMARWSPVASAIFNTLTLDDDAPAQAPVRDPGIITFEVEPE